MAEAQPTLHPNWQELNVADLQAGDEITGFRGLGHTDRFETRMAGQMTQGFYTHLSDEERTRIPAHYMNWLARQYAHNNFTSLSGHLGDAVTRRFCEVDDIYAVALPVTRLSDARPGQRRLLERAFRVRQGVEIDPERIVIKSGFVVAARLRRKHSREVVGMTATKTHLEVNTGDSWPKVVRVSIDRAKNGETLADIYPNLRASF